MHLEMYADVKSQHDRINHDGTPSPLLQPDHFCILISPQNYSGQRETEYRSLKYD